MASIKNVRIFHACWSHVIMRSHGMQTDWCTGAVPNGRTCSKAPEGIERRTSPEYILYILVACLCTWLIDLLSCYLHVTFQEGDVMAI